MKSLKNSRFVHTVKHLILSYMENDVGHSAAALTYYLIFTFFPLLVFLNGLLGTMDISLVDLANELSRVLPVEIINIIVSYIEYVTSERSSHVMFLGLVVSLYFPMRAVNFIMVSINKVNKISKKRPFVRHYLLVFIFTISIMLSIIASFVFITVGRTVLTFLSDYFYISNAMIELWNYLRFLLLGGMLFLVLSTLYYIAPYKRLKFRQVMPGAFASLASSVVMSIVFSFYVENMANYSLIYGSLGAIVVLLIWLYFNALTILMGAHLNYILLKDKAPPN